MLTKGDWVKISAFLAPNPIPYTVYLGEDHPELDTSSELDIKGVKIYQSMIGAPQWVVSLGSLDVATAVMTLPSFHSAP